MRTGMVLLVGLVIFGIGSGNLFAQAGEQVAQADTAGMEKYVKKVFVDAKWGSGPGEFVMREGGSVGSIVVDNKGNLYIPNIKAYHQGRITKAAILKYNRDGKYLGDILIGDNPIPFIVNNYGVDDDGNIFISSSLGGTMTQDSIGIRFVAKYNPNGVKLETYWFDIDTTVRPKYMRGDLTPVIRNHEIIIEEKNKEFVIGRVDRPAKGFVEKVREKATTYKPLRVNKDNGYIEIEQLPTKNIIRVGIPKNLLSELNGDMRNIYFGDDIYKIDKYGNGYLGVLFLNNNQCEIWKFSPQGELLARFPMGHSPDSDNLYGWIGTRPQTIDDEGNVYWLRVLMEGIQVVKYELAK